MFSALLSSALLRKGGPVIIVLAAAVFLFFQGKNYLDDLNGKVESETRAKLEYKAQLDSISVYNAALKDTLRNIADHRSLPEALEVEIPVPHFGPPVPDSSSGVEPDPFATFWTEQQWRSWLAEHCRAGVIEVDSSITWENGLGARVQGEFHYGYGVDYASLDYLLITPTGSYRPPETSAPQEKEYPQRLLGVGYKSDGYISVMGSITSWRGFLITPGIGYNCLNNKTVASITIFKAW